MKAASFVPLSLAWIAGCGASPAPTEPIASPSLASSIDPVTGKTREPAPQAFAAGTSEHLCTGTEEVVFACTLEGPSPQILTSLCMKKGSPRRDPVVVGRERVDGRTEDAFAGQSSQMMITVLEANGVAFSVEVEQRSPGGAFGTEKQTDPKSPNAAARYRRNVTIGKEGPGVKTTHTACDPAHPITDNLEAMRAYKL